jgi:outer membrane protein assembly factor BamE (lipoprotein component of BamABCDE complex)
MMRAPYASRWEFMRGDHMKKRTILLAVVAMLAAAVVSFAADDVNMGTWKLNEAKSKIAAGTTKNNTVVYAAAGDSVKVTVDGVTADGKPAHNEWTGKFDGKDYPVTGDAASDTRAYKRVNSHTLAMTIKKDGKVTSTGRITVSADGKSRTVAISGTDASGKKMSSTAVYDKQ